MIENSQKKIGEVKVSKYIVKDDRGLLRLNEAKIVPCKVPDNEAKSRGCIERGELKNWCWFTGLSAASKKRMKLTWRK